MCLSVVHTYHSLPAVDILVGRSSFRSPSPHQPCSAGPQFATTHIIPPPLTSSTHFFPGRYGICCTATPTKGCCSRDLTLGSVLLHTRLPTLLPPRESLQPSLTARPLHVRSQGPIGARHPPYHASHFLSIVLSIPSGRARSPQSGRVCVWSPHTQCLFTAPIPQLDRRRLVCSPSPHTAGRFRLC